MFFKEGKAVPRSAAIAEWIIDMLAKSSEEQFARVFEVGAGQGNLILQLIKHYPDSEFFGCEVNEDATKLAQGKKLRVVPGDYKMIRGKYDLIIAFGVLEHVPSPFKFLSNLSEHLTEHGHIVVGQPMQDVKSYDIFFVDHLYHFHTRHIEGFANRAGLEQVAVMRSPWFSNNFSIHLLKKSIKKKKAIEYVPTVISETLTYWKKVFQKSFDPEKLSNKKFAIYGMGEIACLLYCYGGLSKLDITFGIDDYPQKYLSNIFNVPVKGLEELTELDKSETEAVILTLNPIYHEFVIEKCYQKGLKVINFFGM